MHGLLRGTIIISFILIFLGPANADERVGTVVGVKGEVLLSRAGMDEGITLRVMDELFLNDTVTTRKGSRLKILFSDNSVVTVVEESTVNLAEYTYHTRHRVRKNIIQLIMGAVRAQIDRANLAEEEFTIRTSTAIAGAKGTDFVVESPQPEITRVFTLEGIVAVQSVYHPDVVRTVTAGRYTEVMEKKPPGIPEAMKEDFMIQLRQRFSLEDKTTRLPPALTRDVSKGRSAQPYEPGTELAAPAEPQSGGRGPSRRFVNPQVSGQVGQEPPRMNMRSNAAGPQAGGGTGPSPQRGDAGSSSATDPRQLVPALYGDSVTGR